MILNWQKRCLFFAAALLKHSRMGNTVRSTAKLVTWPLISTISSHTVAIIFSSHSTLFFLLKQLWDTIGRHESATVHVTQQVLARLPKSMSLFMPPTLLSWAGTVREAKALPLTTSPGTACSSRSGLSSCFFLMEFSEIIGCSIKRIFYWYLSRLYRDIYIYILLLFYCPALVWVSFRCFYFGNSKLTWGFSLATHKAQIGGVLQWWLSFWKFLPTPHRISGAQPEWPPWSPLTKSLLLRLQGTHL